MLLLLLLAAACCCCCCLLLLLLLLLLLAATAAASLLRCCCYHRCCLSAALLLLISALLFPPHMAASCCTQCTWCTQCIECVDHALSMFHGVPNALAPPGVWLSRLSDSSGLPGGDQRCVFAHIFWCLAAYEVAGRVPGNTETNKVLDCCCGGVVGCAVCAYCMFWGVTRTRLRNGARACRRSNPLSPLLAPHPAALYPPLSHGARAQPTTFPGPPAATTFWSRCFPPAISRRP